MPQNILPKSPRLYMLGARDPMDVTGNMGRDRASDHSIPTIPESRDIDKDFHSPQTPGLNHAQETMSDSGDFQSPSVLSAADIALDGQISKQASGLGLDKNYESSNYRPQHLRADKHKSNIR